MSLIDNGDFCSPAQLFGALLDSESGEVKPTLDLKSFSDITGAKLTRAVICEICSLYCCNKHVKLTLLNLSQCLTKDNSDSFLLEIASKCGYNLEKVFLCDCFVTHVGLRALTIYCSSNLCSLDFSGCHYCIDDKNLRIVASFGRTLESLELSGCKKLSNVGVCELIRVCIRLKYLGLSGCKRIGDRTCRYISQYCNTTIISLNLCGCRNIEDNGLTSIFSSCMYLKVMKISHNNLVQGKWSNMIYSNIEHLQVSYCEKIDSGEFSRISQCAQLVELNVSGTSLFNLNNFMLIIQQCKHLLSLNLSDCGSVDDRCMEAISRECEQLIELNIAHCRLVTEKGLEIVILSCSEISFVDCTGCDCISSDFLEEQAVFLDFSELIISDEFVGFQQKMGAEKLRYVRRIKIMNDKHATLLQKMYRSFITRKGIMMQAKKARLIEKVLPRIQACLRGQFQRKNWIQFCEELKKNNSVIIIQSFWRQQQSKMKLSLKQNIYRHEILAKYSAVSIQKTYRTYLAVKLLVRLRNENKIMRDLELKYSQLLCRSIILVQRNVRRHQSKVLLHSIKDKIRKCRDQRELQISSVIKLQTWVRRFCARYIHETLKEEQKIVLAKSTVALKLQALFRQKIAMLLFKNRKLCQLNAIKVLAASLIQRSFRWFLFARTLQMKREQKHFHNIQAGCAILIQSLIRCYFSSKQVESIRVRKRENQIRIGGAKSIQRIFRGFLGRRQYFIKIEEKDTENERQLFIIRLTNETSAVEQLKLNVNKNEKMIRRHQDEVDTMAKELFDLRHKPSSHIDSTRVNSFLQRHKTSVLIEQLTKSLTKVKDEISFIFGVNEKNITNIRLREREIRQLNRKLALLQNEIKQRARTKHRACRKSG